jgi:sulfatase modifying factor 1
VHNVCIQAFEFSQFAVTQGEWHRVMVFPNTSYPSYFKGDERLPVESVNWAEAQRFVWLMSFFGRRNYRLASEAEWEYAARAGTATSRYWGDTIDDGCAYENIADQSLKRSEPDYLPEYANCTDGFANTAPVGTFKPNPWGLYDMLGNVATWVTDCFVDSYRPTPVDGTPNMSGSCAYRVIRGGSWDENLRAVRAASRIDDAPIDRSNDVGIRIAR